MLHVLQESIQHDPLSPIENDGDDRGQTASSGSPDQSDDVSGVSTESAEPDINITSFINYGQTKFQMKILPTYSCSALPQPLLPKNSKGEYLVSKQQELGWQHDECMWMITLSQH